MHEYPFPRTDQKNIFVVLVAVAVPLQGFQTLEATYRDDLETCRARLLYALLTDGGERLAI